MILLKLKTNANGFLWDIFDIFKENAKKFWEKWGFVEIFGFFQHRFIIFAKLKNENELIKKNHVVSNNEIIVFQH